MSPLCVNYLACQQSENPLGFVFKCLVRMRSPVRTGYQLHELGARCFNGFRFFLLLSLELLSRTPNQKTGTKTGTLSSNKIIIYEYEMIWGAVGGKRENSAGGAGKMSCSAVAEQAFFFLSEYDTILIEAVISQVSCD